MSNGGDAIIFSNAATNAEEAAGTLNERVRIDRLGNVGIGTTNPQKKLDISTSAGNSGPLLSLNNRGDTGVGYYNGITFGLDSNSYPNQYGKGGILYESRDGYNRGKLHLAVDNTADSSNVALADAILTVDGTTGNVGIGTTTPSGTLHVITKTVFQDNVPAMTSNSAPSPLVASASTEWSSSYSAYKAFDKVTDSIGWTTTNTVLTGWLKIDLGSGKIVTKYVLTGAIAGFTDRSPKDWTFKGSNDNSTWTTLDTQINVPAWTGYEQRTYTFANSISYRYYMLNVTANSGSTSVLSVTEMNLFSIDPVDFVITNGSVGIGNTAPLSKLGVTGNASVGATYGVIAAPTSGMIIEGNVGIGTSVPAEKLHIQSTAATTALRIVADDTGFNPRIDFIDDRDPSYRNARISVLRDMSNGGDAIIFSNAATNAEEAAGTLNERVRIDRLGNVGIGTTNPSTNLEVNGTASTTSLVVSGTANIGWERVSNYCASATACDVSCSAGKKVLGGGCFTAAGAMPTRNFPANDTTWRCWVATSDNITSTAICARVN